MGDTANSGEVKSDVKKREVGRADFLFKDGDVLDKGEIDRRMTLADLRFKEAQALKMENDVLKSGVSKDASLFRLEVNRGKYIEIMKHKSEMLYLTNTFIKALDGVVDKVIIVVNNNLEGGVSNILAESLTRDLKDVVSRIKAELAGES
jgi:hypothetical protein